ncbi:MAG TPA: EAL domain-containing protein [Pyrinomonadaceae bacterium]|nr:EAL domain-containing protein [Pyrinomonadaceae bacterium]
MAELHKENILIIDDEAMVRNVLSELLCDKYACFSASSAEEALEVIQNKTFNLIISDIDLGGLSGIDIIPKIHEVSPETVVVMISGKQTIESAIDAMRVGAFDYIKKPFDLDHVEVAVRRALDHNYLLSAKQRYESYLENLVKQRTNELHYLAYHDALTDLPNRILFEDRFFQALNNFQPAHQKIAVLFLSLDRFKIISDTLGHIPGFKLLQEVATRLKKCVGENVTIARFEGDEFAMFFTQIKNLDEVVKIAGDINRAIDLPYNIEEHEIFTTASMGISFFPEDGEDIQALMKNAGIALSSAKDHGGNTFRLYSSEMNLAALKRVSLENDLRRAIEREEFEVYFQPKINIVNRQIAGMEALVRWNHPENGVISPIDFIPLAEETGLIVPLGEWILRSACKQNRKWQEEGFKPLPIAVNVSPRQLENPQLGEFIESVLAETQMEPKHLELEVTESSIMSNPETAAGLLGNLKKIGIRISIDDFGTGYSSLSYLKHLPVDVLKIDRAFVQDLAVNQDDAALVMTIITLAHQLRLKVVAEGVENEDQLRFLQLLKCDEWQGFLYSKPVTAIKFAAFLNNENPAN